MDFINQADLQDYILKQSMGGSQLPTVLRVFPEEGETVEIPSGTASTAVLIGGDASLDSLIFDLPDSVGSIVRMYFSIDVSELSFLESEVWNAPMSALNGDSYMLQCIDLGQWVRMSA